MCVFNECLHARSAAGIAGLRCAGAGGAGGCALASHAAADCSSAHAIAVANSSTDTDPGTDACADPEAYAGTERVNQ